MVTKAPTEPTSQRRHKTLYCITVHRDQHKANGLAFTPVWKYGRLFFFSFLFFSNNDRSLSIMGLHKGHSNTKRASFSTTLWEKWYNLSSLEIEIVDHCLVSMRILWATSHTSLRACDHFTSSALIGGKDKSGPSSLHTMLEGPME